jgi:hypothetical protein
MVYLPIRIRSRESCLIVKIFTSVFFNDVATL